MWYGEMMLVACGCWTEAWRGSGRQSYFSGSEKETVRVEIQAKAGDWREQERVLKISAVEQSRLVIRGSEYGGTERSGK